jgi:hypothetical protein
MSGMEKKTVSRGKRIRECGTNFRWLKIGLILVNWYGIRNWLTCYYKLVNMVLEIG